MEDIVAQDKAHRIITDELLANDERLRKTIGRGLLGILETYAVVTSVAKQALEAW